MSDELKEAVRRTLELRGTENLGWAGAWRSAVYARLGDAETALDYQRRGTVDISLHPSPLDSDCTPSFEGNQAIQGWGTALCELFAHSTPDEITLLPALPAEFADFEIRGMGTRCGVRMDFAGKNGKLTSLKLYPGRDGKVTLCLPDCNPVSFDLKAGQEIMVIG